MTVPTGDGREEGPAGAGDGARAGAGSSPWGPEAGRSGYHLLVQGHIGICRGEPGHNILGLDQICTGYHLLVQGDIGTCRGEHKVPYTGPTTMQVIGTSKEPPQINQYHISVSSSPRDI